LDDYEVTLTRPLSDAETTFHRTILNLLFGERGLDWRAMLRLVASRAADGPDNGAAVGTTVTLSKLQRDQHKRQANAKAIRQLQVAVKQDLTERGYFERSLTDWTGATVLRLVVGVVVVVLVVILVSPLLLFLVFPSVAIVAFAYERRTTKGYEALNHLKGFKDFLSVTEKERYMFHNAPSKSPEQFMQYLPYSIAFGVEKAWAEVFADMQITNPEWYQSSSSAATFNAVAFTNSMTTFSNSFSTSSGSSGGGSAGGGSGGGGGGSW
jgi:uncharacterized membrane protein YgcG